MPGGPGDRGATGTLGVLVEVVRSRQFPDPPVGVVLPRDASGAAEPFVDHICHVIRVSGVATITLAHVARQVGKLDVLVQVRATLRDRHNVIHRTRHRVRVHETRVNRPPAEPAHTLVALDHHAVIDGLPRETPLPRSPSLLRVASVLPLLVPIPADDLRVGRAPREVVLTASLAVLSPVRAQVCRDPVWVAASVPPTRSADVQTRVPRPVLPVDLSTILQTSYLGAALTPHRPVSPV